MLQGHDISNILLTIVMDGTKFLGNLSAHAGINAARNGCSTEGGGKDRTNSKVVPAHVMKAYVENASTIALILNPGTRGDESSAFPPVKNANQNWRPGGPQSRSGRFCKCKTIAPAGN